MAVLKYKNPDTNTWEKLSGFIQLGTDVPVGAICEYAGETIPEDYLQCDGSSLLRTDYPDLFNAIGTTYGSVDSLHFNLPDIKSRTVVGLNSDDSDFNTLGKTGGNKTSTEINCGDSTYGLSTAPNLGYTDRSLIRKTAISGTHGEIDAKISLLQPYITLYYIIKAKTNTYSISKVIDNLDSDSSTDSLSANQGRVLNNKIDNLTTVYTGTNITAPTCEGFGKIRKIYGYSTQKTRDGKNKFSLSYIRSASVFEVTETGVNLKNCWTADIYTHDDLLKVMKPSTTYTMRSKAKVISRPSTMISHQYGTMLLYRPGSSSLGSVVTPVLQMTDKETIALNTEKEYITTFTTPADLTDVRFLAYSFYGNNDGSTTGSALGEIDLTEVMLVEGTYTAETFPEYEPYGVSPSPDYPSEINNVGDNINIFDKSATMAFNDTTKIELDTGVRIQQTVAGNYKNARIELGQSELLGKTITIHSNVSSSAENKPLAIFFYGSSSSPALVNSGYSISDNGEKEVTFTVLSSFPSNCDRIYLFLYSNSNGTGNVGDYVDYTDLKIVIADNATPYSPYGEGSINIKTQNEDNTQEQDKVITLAKPLYQDCYLAEDGIHYTRKQIVLDGSEDEGWSLSATNTSNQSRFTSKIIEDEVKRPSNADEIANIICSHFIKESANNTYRRSDGIAIHSNGSIYLYYNAFKEYTIDQFKTWLSNNPITLEYELATEVINPYIDDISMLITQYDNKTNISNSYNVNMEVELTENKSISSINKDIGELQKKISSLAIYSKEEIKTAEAWIDGKPIYRKVFIMDSLPNNSTVSFKIAEEGIIDLITNIHGVAKRNDGLYTFVLPYSNKNAIANNIGLLGYKDSNKDFVEVATGADRSNCKGYITVEYTKLSD